MSTWLCIVRQAKSDHLFLYKKAHVPVPSLAYSPTSTSSNSIQILTTILPQYSDILSTMQFTQLLTLLVSVPFLVAANPVNLETSLNVGRSLLERRGGKDFCGSDLRSAGDSCTFGSAESEPHACGIKDRSVVVSLSRVFPGFDLVGGRTQR